MDNDDRSRENLPPSDEDNGSWTTVGQKPKRNFQSQPRNNTNPVSTNSGAPGASSSQRSNNSNPPTMPPVAPSPYPINRSSGRLSDTGSGPAPQPRSQSNNSNRNFVQAGGRGAVEQQNRPWTPQQRTSNLPPTSQSTSSNQWSQPNTSRGSAPRPATQGSTSRRSTPNNQVALCCNHFKVQFRARQPWPIIYRYRIAIYSKRSTDTQDQAPHREVNSKGLKRKIFKALSEGKPELNRCAYDGASELYSTRLLSDTLEGPNEVLIPQKMNPDYRRPQNIGEASRQEELVYVVIIEQSQSNPIEVSSFPSQNAAGHGDPGPTDKIILQALMIFWLDSSLNAAGDERSVLRVGSNYYLKPEPGKGKIDNNNTVVVWGGFHSSFRLTYEAPNDQVPRLVLNHSDVMTAVLVSKPVEDFITDFLKTNGNTAQLVNLTRKHEERNMVSAALSGIRVQMKCGKYLREFTIRDLTSQTSITHSFTVEELQENGEIEENTVNVRDYFRSKHGYRLQNPHWPLLCMKGRDNGPVYIPIEVCTILDGQRYMRLSPEQKSSILILGKVTPIQKKEKIEKDLNTKAAACEARNNPLGDSFGIQIERRMMTVQGQLLVPPTLYFSNRSMNIEAKTGRWNYLRQSMLDPVKLWSDEWAVYQFNDRFNDVRPAHHLWESLMPVFANMGMVPDDPNEPTCWLEEIRQSQQKPFDRIRHMLDIFRNGRRHKLIVAILPSKSPELYVPMKKICETTADGTMITQCVIKAQCDPRKNLASLAANLALKINLKMGGTNSDVKLENILGGQPTCIFGIDVSHGPTQNTGKPSIAAVVASVKDKRWSRYAPQVRKQIANQERVEHLQEMVKDLLEEFRRNNNGQYPRQIVVYRDGVSESQFQTVGTDELGDFKQVCEELNLAIPITFIIVQKRHHTRFFQPRQGMPFENMDPGTVVTSQVCQTRNQDFYLCSHKSFIKDIRGGPGVTSRPAHYTILRDEINLGQVKIYNLTNSLCYCFGRTTTAVSIPAPVYYAHVAAKHYSYLVDRDAPGGGPALININNELKAAPYRMFYV